MNAKTIVKKNSTVNCYRSSQKSPIVIYNAPIVLQQDKILFILGSVNYIAHIYRYFHQYSVNFIFSWDEQNLPNSIILSLNHFFNEN